jgi:hypothetical protein
MAVGHLWSGERLATARGENGHGGSKEAEACEEGLVDEHDNVWFWRCAELNGVSLRRSWLTRNNRYRKEIEMLRSFEFAVICFLPHEAEIAAQ